MNLARKIGDGAGERGGMAALLERMTAAVFFVELSGRITYANDPARRLLAEGDLFREGGGGLLPVDPGARRLLEQALEGDRVAPLTGVVNTPEGRRTLSIIPPTAVGGRCGVVMLTSPEPELSEAGPHLAKAYGLTSAETRVLTALLRRRTLAQIAAELGVTLRTVKAHLQKLFEKTGARRQSDLVGEALSLIPPMRLS